MLLKKKSLLKIKNVAQNKKKLLKIEKVAEQNLSRPSAEVYIRMATRTT